MTKYCSNCGVSANEGDKFCRECGNTLDSNYTSNSVSNNVENNKKTNTAGFLAIIGFILSFFGFEIFLSLASTVLCFISLKTSDGSKESLKGLAISGIIINFLKLLIFIILVQLLISGLD
jgi:uncharacterized membrane protein YkvI